MEIHLQEQTFGFQMKWSQNTLWIVANTSSSWEVKFTPVLWATKLWNDCDLLDVKLEIKWGCNSMGSALSDFFSLIIFPLSSWSYFSEIAFFLP